MNIDELRALLAKATPGPWKAEPARLMVDGQQGPIMSYLSGGQTTGEGMTVSLASERIADHKTVAALRNHADALLDCVEAAKRVWDTVPGDWTGPQAHAHAVALNNLRDALRRLEEIKP